MRAFPIGTRLLLRVEFDLPRAYSDPSQNTHPWAVALKVKAKASEIDADNDAMIAVTCQFNRDSTTPGVIDGARVNTPGGEQRDQQKPLDGPPLDYNRFSRGCLLFYPPPRFVLEHAFCGVGASSAQPPTALLGYSVGSGKLSIANRWDMRVYSHTALSNSTSIGALGVSVATQTGVGSIRARLRHFSVSLW